MREREKRKTWVSRTGKAVKVVPQHHHRYEHGQGPRHPRRRAEAGRRTGGLREVRGRGVDAADSRRLPGDRHPDLQRRARARKPGSYLLIHEIASLRVRDHYYGTQDCPRRSDALWKQCGEPCDRAWNRLFDDLTTDTGYTGHYYALVKK